MTNFIKRWLIVLFDLYQVRDVHTFYVLDGGAGRKIVVFLPKPRDADEAKSHAIQLEIVARELRNPFPVAGCVSMLDAGTFAR